MVKYITLILGLFLLTVPQIYAEPYKVSLNGSGEIIAVLQGLSMDLTMERISYSSQIK